MRSILLHSEARALVTAWHYAKGCTNTSTYRHGLYPASQFFEPPRGVAMWIAPTPSSAKAIAGEDWRGVLSLTRLVVQPGMPTNSASFLLGRSINLIDRERWPVLVTYADTALGHTGAIYKATNWRCDGPVPAGDVWLDKDGRRWQRKRGPRSYTRAEMLARGYTQVPAAPKIRFVLDARR